MADLIEGTHYELTPADEAENPQAWSVRLLEGPHPETVITFGAIRFEGRGGSHLSFNFVIESTPDENLTTEDLELQTYVGDVLESIMISAAEDGSLVYGDIDKGDTHSED